MRNIAICDDSVRDRFVLHTALKRLFQERGEDVQIAEYSHPDALAADLEEGYEQFDLLFFDAVMNGRNGIEAARQLRMRQVTTPILFLSSTPDYAVESYEVEASGYLLKPLAEKKLQLFVNRLLLPPRRPQIAFRCKGMIRYLFHDEILWIESEKHSVIFHLTDGSAMRTNEKLGEIEARLKDPRFLRCHQSFMVNMDHVADVKNSFILEDGSQVLIRVRSRKEIRDTYHSYFMEHALPANLQK
jgi:DNA-binding LytR/AlgR family response regulator